MCVCAGVCVYFVMTRLGEPVDLTVKNGENLFPLHSEEEARVQTLLVLDEGRVCLLCLSSNLQPFLFCGHGGSVCDNPVSTQLYPPKKKQIDGHNIFSVEIVENIRADGGEPSDRQLLWSSHEGSSTTTYKSNSVFMPDLDEVLDP